MASRLMPRLKLVESNVPTLLSRSARRTDGSAACPRRCAFLVVPAASCACLMHPPWLHHRPGWCRVDDAIAGHAGGMGCRGSELALRRDAGLPEAAVHQIYR